MICLPGLDCKDYWERIRRGAPLPDIECPTCRRRLRGHGWYGRYLSGQRVSLRRLRCRACSVTHALLPEEVCAYQDLTLSALEQAALEEGPSAAARAAGCEGAVRRARRWLRSLVWKQLLHLLPAVGDFWRRTKTLVGSAPGMLLRLRHWIWSHLGFLLGGPCGLFRAGRPPSHPRRSAT